MRTKRLHNSLIGGVITIVSLSPLSYMKSEQSHSQKQNVECCFPGTSRPPVGEEEMVIKQDSVSERKYEIQAGRTYCLDTVQSNKYFS